MGSACTPRCAAQPTSARRWSNCADTSPAPYWPTNACKPTRRAGGGAQAQDPVSRRHHAPGDVAAGVHAAAGSAGTKATAAPDPLPWCTGIQRQAARAGGAASARACRSGGAACRVRGALCASPPSAAEWARLLKRIFALDLEHCSNCGDELRTTAAVLEAPLIGSSCA